MFLKKELWIKIKKSGKENKGEFYIGETIVPGKKCVKFWFFLSDESSYLQIKGLDKRILKTVVSQIGEPNIKWNNRGWFSYYNTYAWGEKSAIKKLYNSLSRSQAMKSGLFSFLGYRNIQLLKAPD